MHYIPLFIFAFSCVALCAPQYKTPVIFMHGLTGNEKSGVLLQALLEDLHPGQPFYSLSVDNGDESFKNLYIQIQDIQDVIQTLIDKYPDQFANGFHLVGHSQGGLLTRCVVEESDKFNIRNYVSLAGVQNGEYGNCALFGDADCNALSEHLYSPDVRNTTSVAQFWRTPDRDTYMNGNVFLPVMNNEANPDIRRKQNILRLKHMYLFASESDGLIAPWQSSHMGFFDSDGQTIVPMEKQLFYVQDTIGLRTLNEDGRLSLVTVNNVTHNEWLMRPELIKEYILPCLED